MLYSSYFCPSISSLSPSFPPSLHHFDLVVRASLSLLSGPQFLAGLLKCDFLHPVFKKGYWALQASCCFFLCIYKFALLSFLFFCFICLCFPSLIKPASLPLTGSPSLVDHYHSSIFLLHPASQCDPPLFSTVPHPFYPFFLPSFICLLRFFSQLISFDTSSVLSKMFLRLVWDPWLNWRKAWKWTRRSIGILTKEYWS